MSEEIARTLANILYHKPGGYIEVVEDGPAEEPGVVRFFCTRDQLRALGRWGVESAQRGRPICTQCGQPEEPEGHFCVKKNGGHKHD